MCSLLLKSEDFHLTIICQCNVEWCEWFARFSFLEKTNFSNLTLWLAKDGKRLSETQEQTHYFAHWIFFRLCAFVTARSLVDSLQTLGILSKQGGNAEENQFHTISCDNRPQRCQLSFFKCKFQKLTSDFPFLVKFVFLVKCYVNQMLKLKFLPLYLHVFLQDFGHPAISSLGSVVCLTM